MKGNEIIALNVFSRGPDFDRKRNGSIATVDFIRGYISEMEEKVRFPLPEGLEYFII